MADKRSNKIECRSKEGVEDDIPMRAFVYGQIGENIYNSDDFTEDTLNQTREVFPSNLIKVEDGAANPP